MIGAEDAMKRMLLLTMFLCHGSVGLAQQKQLADTPKPPSVKCLEFSPDGKSLAVVHAVSNTLVVWDIASREKKFVIRDTGPLSAVAYSPTKNILAVAAGTVAKLLDPANGEVRRTLDGHKGTIRSLAFTADGKQLATGANDKSVILWNLATSETLHTFSDFQGNVVSVAISPDRKWLATACGREDIAKLWNLEQPDEPPRLCEIPFRNPSRAVFSPDSRYLIIPHGAIVDIASGTEFLRFTHFWDANNEAVAPDGRWLALATQYLPVHLLPLRQSADADEDRRIAELIARFQDDDYQKRENANQELANLDLAALPQLRANLESPDPEVRIRCRWLIERLQKAEFGIKLAGHAAKPTWVAFSPDSKLLASGDMQGAVKIWNIAEGKELISFEPQ
jgi:WD40 repeat protein